jgi:SSS family solute:Na+ symporter
MRSDPQPQQRLRGRNIVRPDCTPRQEAQNAKVVSLIVKLGALVFIIFLPLQ